MDLQKNTIKAVFIALILWLVSALLKNALFVLNIIFTPLYYLLTLKWKTGGERLASWFYKNALANDQSGNVQSAAVFQVVFTKKGGEAFGNEDDTVSYVLARNKYQNKLTFLGRLLGGILEAIDPGHLDDSIEHKIEADRNAAFRLKADKYYE